MRWRDDIEARMADHSARVLCLDPTGGRTVPLPDELISFADRVPETTGPLDLFAPDDRSEIVKAFGLAKLRGTSSTQAPTRSGEQRQFDFYNEVDALGCYVITMGPPTGMQTKVGGSAGDLPVRAASWDLDMAGNIVDAHPDFGRMLGWEPAEIIGRSSLDLIHPDDHEKGIVGWIELLDEGLGARSRMRQRFLEKGGGWRWLEDTSTNLLDDPERGVVSTELIDISDEMAALEEAERREALLTRLTDALPTGVLHISPQRLPVFWNQRWMELLGNASPSIEGLLEQLEEREIVSRAIDQSFDAGADADIDVTILGSNDVNYGRLHLRALEHADGSAEVLITLEDTTSSRELQQDLHDLAHRDALTGLLGNLGSRSLVEDHLLDPDAHDARALLYVDLDSFKLINDTHGHATGDAVLQAVGRGITAAVRRRDAVARIGGDEFIVAVKDVSSADEIQEITTRIHSALRQAESSIDLPVEIRASIGVAEVKPGDSFDSLLRRADQAMYRAKRAKQQRLHAVPPQSASVRPPTPKR